MTLKIGIVGATGIVGSELISLLEERNIAIDRLLLIASERSDGKKLKFCKKLLTVEKLEEKKLSNLDYLFFCSTEEISKKFVPIAAERGICCIDNSAAFRQQHDIPLVIPEINPADLIGHNNIIANPNCSTIIALMALFPLHSQFGLQRFCSATYQAVSGAGLRGITALEQDNAGNFSQSSEVFGEQILYNAIPKIGGFYENGYTSEEMKMLNESKKILSLPNLKVSSTCVRIPSIRAHSLSIIAQFEKPFDMSLAEKVLSTNENLNYFSKNLFPTAIRQSGKNNVAIGRLRMDMFLDNAVSMWIVGDQIRKGAALNALQIMEKLESQKI